MYPLPHLEAYNAMTPAQRMDMYGTYQDPAAIATDFDDVDLGGGLGGGLGVAVRLARVKVRVRVRVRG